MKRDRNKGKKKKKITLQFSGGSITPRSFALLRLYDIVNDAPSLSQEEAWLIAQEALEIDSTYPLAQEVERQLADGGTVAEAAAMIERAKAEDAVVSAEPDAAEEEYRQHIEINRYDILGGRFPETDYRCYLARALAMAETDGPDYRQVYADLLAALYYSGTETLEYQVRAPAAAGHTVIRSVQIITLAAANDKDRRWQWRLARAARDAETYLFMDCERHSQRHRWDLVREAKEVLRSLRPKKK